MAVSTVGRLLFENAVPQRFHDSIPVGKPVNSSDVKNLLQRIAEESPQDYKKVSHDLLKLGSKAATETESSFGLEDLKSPFDKAGLVKQVEAEEDKIFANKTLMPDQRNAELVKLYAKHSFATPDISYQAALAQNSGLAKMVASGARGNKSQLNSSIGADWLVLDSESNPVPVPLKNNYAEGLDPAEYYAGSYGTRKGLTSTKFCCAEKTLVRMADFSVMAIEDIRPGMWVMGSDKNGNTLPVMVSEVFSNGPKDCWKFIFGKITERSVIEFEGTLDHRLLVVRKEEYIKVKVGDLKENMGLPCIDGYCEFLRKIQTGIKNTYDIQVDHPDHLYVLENGIISSNSVRDAGFLGKQLSAAAHDLVITEKDCGTNRGIPSTTDDKDNIGAILSKPVGGIPAGSVLDGRSLKMLRDHGVKNIQVRSPLTCGSKNGLCATCAGIRERNRLSSIMDNVGVTASSSLAEPLSQGSLCLMKGTLVRMADWSTKPIEEIQVGDWVLGSDKDGKTFPVQVVNTFYRGRKECYRTVFTQSGVDICSTLEHKILYKHESGSYHVLAIGVVRDYAECSVESIGIQDTYDIEVNHPDHLFVLEHGVISHNSEKHSGGVASSSGRSLSGFERVNALAQIPDQFPNGATVADQDGTITKIDKAPQGGHYMHVGDKPHYISGDNQLKVKRGDEVEAGDVLSDGIPNPSEIVKHKGIGEGRLYFTNAVREAFKDSNLTAHRRNVEVIGRAVINHVQVNHPEGIGHHLPDDIVEYSALEPNYQPREDAKILPVSKAKGMYLEKPILHYTIGTRVTPSVQKKLEENGETEVHVHHETPGFEPHMVRLMENPMHKQDWMARFAGSYLTKNLMQAVHQGDASSDIHGTSFLPALAYGKEFGNPGSNRVGY